MLAEINPRDRAWRDLANDTSVCFVPMAAVSERTASIQTPQNRPLSEVRKGFTQFRRGDIIMAKITPCMENGKIAILDEMETEFGFGSTEFHVVRPKSSIAGRYLYYFLRQDHVRKAAKNKMQGAVGQQRVPADFLENIQLPSPPPSEQRKIVELLDQADVLRKRRSEADRKAERILPALFYTMFGDPATNTMGWEMKSLGDPDISEINPRLPRGTLVDDTIVSFVPMADVDEVWGRIVGDQTRTFAQVKKGFTYFSDGDVLFAKITPCMENGKAALARNLRNGVGFGSTEFHVLRASSQVRAEWIYALVRLPIFRARAKASFTGSAGQQRVPADYLRQFMVPVPPLETQNNFADCINTIISRVGMISSARESLNALFSTMLHRAFTGDLTTTWREGHMKELLQEVEIQARELGLEAVTS